MFMLYSDWLKFEIELNSLSGKLNRNYYYNVVSYVHIPLML